MSIQLALPPKSRKTIRVKAWRIDKDEVSSIFTRMRCNLLGKPTRCKADPIGTRAGGHHETMICVGTYM